MCVCVYACVRVCVCGACVCVIEEGVVCAHAIRIFGLLFLGEWQFNELFYGLLRYLQCVGLNVSSVVTSMRVLN